MNTNEHEYSLSGKIIHGELAYRVIGLAMEVHNKLGAGFLEKVYENALMVALKRESIAVQQQAPIKVHFDGVVVGEYIADLLVDGKLIIELKAVGAISDIHRAQTINYLRATKFHLAIILKFRQTQARVRESRPMKQCAEYCVVLFVFIRVHSWFQTK